MDFSLALMMFFGGVISHMFAIKIFGTYSKSASYRITFINCIALLKFIDGMAQDLLKSIDPDERLNIEAAFEHWRQLALFSLKNSVNDQMWRQTSIADWRLAMKILAEVEKI
jgi:hypothetical protein